MKLVVGSRDRASCQLCPWAATDSDSNALERKILKHLREQHLRIMVSKEEGKKGAFWYSGVRWKNDMG